MDVICLVLGLDTGFSDRLYNMRVIYIDGVAFNSLQAYQLCYYAKVLMWQALKQRTLNGSFIDW